MNSDTKQIQKFLDSDEYKSPIGVFDIDKTLVWNISKKIDWANTILKPIDIIDVLYISARRWDSFNLSIDSSDLLGMITPDKTMITIMYEGSIMTECGLFNTRLIGYDRSKGVVKRPNVHITKGYGYTGIKLDGLSKTGNITNSGNKGSLHNITFDIKEFDGLHTVIDFNHQGLPNSGHIINLTGRNVKRLGVINTVSSNEIKFWYNNGLTLVDDERNLPLLELNSKNNTINYKFVDTNLMKENRKFNQTWIDPNITVTGHSIALLNNGKYNTLNIESRNFGHQFIKELVPLDKI